MKQIINNNFKIISIITEGFKRHSLVGYLVDLYKDDRVMLLQNDGMYYPCKRDQMYYGIDLNKWLDSKIDDFDILIINNFVEHANSKETIDFIEKISQIDKMKNKKVILFFTKRSENCLQEITIEEFTIYREIIEKFSTFIYQFKNSKEIRTYLLENLTTGEITRLKSTYYNHCEKLEEY